MMMGAKAAEQKSVNDVISNAYTIAQTAKVEEETRLAEGKALASARGTPTSDYKNWEAETASKRRNNRPTETFPEYQERKWSKTRTNISLGPRDRAIETAGGKLEGELRSGAFRDKVIAKVDKRMKAGGTVPSRLADGSAGRKPWMRATKQERTKAYMSDMDESIRSIRGYENVQLDVVDGVLGWYLDGVLVASWPKS